MIQKRAIDIGNKINIFYFIQSMPFYNFISAVVFYDNLLYGVLEKFRKGEGI